MIDGDDVVHEVVLPTNVDVTFAMFVEPDRLVRWIGISAELEARPGGRFRFEVVPGQWCEGHYVVVDRPRHLSFTWGWTDPAMGVPPGSSQVDVTFTPAGADRTATTVRLVHSRLPHSSRLLHDDGWTRFVDRLAAVLTTDQPLPYPTETPQERRNALDQRRQRQE